MQRADENPRVPTIIPIVIGARGLGKRKGYDKSHVVHLFKRGQVFWVDYQFQGSRVRASLGTSNRKIADLHRADLEHKILAGLHRQPVQIGLSDLLDQYLSFIAGKLAHKNVSSQKGYFRRFLEIHPRVRVSDLTQAMIEAFLAGLKNGAPSPKTWNVVRGSFHAMLNYAKNHGYCAENVAAKVERRAVPQRTIRFLRSQEQIDQVIGLFEASPLQKMVATFIYAGLRRTEACWLTWEDIDFERALLHVQEKTLEGASWCPKTKHNRVVPISRKLMPFLKRQREASASLWVFPSPEGKRWDADNVTHQFERAVRARKLPWTLLDLRHTFGSHLAIKGVSLYKISKLMGNSPEICRRHYAALVPEEMHEDVEF